MRHACVFGASCSKVDRAYLDAAYEAGALLAGAGVGMVFGGGNTGLMGAAARGVKSQGGEVIGVIPERLNQPGIAFADCDELIVTPDMHSRKAKMESLSFGFLALPGGFGTLEELLEVITLNQLGYLSTPVSILNTNGYYDALLTQLDTCIGQAFTDPACRGIYQAADTPAAAVAWLLRAIPVTLPNKIKDAIKDDKRIRENETKS
ncbi:MAG: TIGR00730 family Rossman fold protein [Candidatus Pelethousia sp.]|nr:TIGR00730 family Rossman fold protein [Candidatus Pelethousia sp.]